MSPTARSDPPQAKRQGVMYESYWVAGQRSMMGMRLNMNEQWHCCSAMWSSEKTLFDLFFLAQHPKEELPLTAAIIAGTAGVWHSGSLMASTSACKSC